MPPVHQQPVWRSFILGRLLATLGTQVVSVAVGWQIYALTGDPLDLGLVGLVQFIPQLVLFPVVGTLVDRYQRNQLLMLSYAFYASGSLTLAWLSATGGATRETILAAVLLVALGRVLSSPSAQALLPQLVPRVDFPRAVALGSSVFEVAVIVGPALGGLLYALSEEAGGNGAAGAYGLAAVLHLAALLAGLSLPSRRATHSGHPPGFAEALDGLRFIWRRRILLSAITLDLFAVLFGGAVALLPIFAKDVLLAGPIELGLLRSAPAVGALGVAVWLAQRPLRRHMGRTLYVAVAVFGVATIVFALSESFWLTMGALAVTGMADGVSVYIRLNVVQMATPDHLRGRVSAAEFVFIGASNELGEMESGLTAGWWGAVPAALFGGVGTLVAAAVSFASSAQLRRVDRLEDVRADPPTVGGDTGPALGV